MAPKSRSRAPPPAAAAVPLQPIPPEAQKQQNGPPSKTLVERIALPMGILTLAAIASPVSQATLAPVFGAIPSAVNHQQALIASSLLGFLLYHFLPKPSAGTIGQALAAYSLWIPVVQTYLFPYSTILGPTWGPILLGFLSCHALVLPATYAAAETMSALNLSARAGPYFAPVLSTSLGLLHLLSFERQFATILPGLASLSAAFTPVKLQLLIGSTFAYLFPSKLTILALPALAHTFLANPHFDSVRNMDVLNQQLALQNWTMLERTWSNTGYVSVLESSGMGYRVLRCDHSLLGGEFLLTDERREREGWVVNESIYSVFETLEAVRLMEDEARAGDADARALVVGLGIGTAPKAFLAHGIETTVVELDPVVHAYAQTYFGLPSNHISILRDAVSWASEAVTQEEREKYDYVLHDVFTGGAEPLSLFTETFIRNLRSLLNPSGAIAINYAGDVKFPLTAKVLNTIDAVFDGQCRIFRDTPHAPASETEGDKVAVNDDFTNIIVFCRNTPGAITFRRPVKEDFLGSKSREQYLLPNPRLEIPFPLHNSPNRRQRVRAEALQVGEEQQWSAQQVESAKKHWYVMRKVLPDVVWELW
ncbi:uncharacterized protein LTR77_005185 [Saxophila tyrrhenica]|uniref:Spermine/spermidine synthase n=1 Tax=Saxophila tyrrhenica TaxID=1690608 RepID=A0AAV9PC56_9PEZI|nr:hypothetical protein LTR77_005185 [Saxophila tyrrhenica]